MPSSRASSPLPANNTVKLSDVLRDRIEKAMEAEGFTVWSEFCRVALTEKCQASERALRENDPDQYARIYGRSTSDGDASESPVARVKASRRTA